MLDSQDRTDNIRVGDLFRPLLAYRRLIWQATVAATVIAALLGGVYLFVQPTAWSATLGFRPTFDGSESGQYPNGLPFSPSDVIAPSIVDEVFAKNDVRSHCAVDAFRSGLTVRNHRQRWSWSTRSFKRASATSG